MSTGEAARTRPILIVYGNRPQPLVFKMIALAQTVSNRPLELLYLDDNVSAVSIPASSQLQETDVVPIPGRRGGAGYMRAANIVRNLFRFTRCIRERRPYAVHAFNFDMVLPAVLARLTGRRFKLVCTIQDTREWMTRPMWRAMQRWVYRFVDVFFVTSRGFEEDLLRKFRLISPGKKVVYTPNVPRRKDLATVNRKSKSEKLTIGYFGFIRGRSAIETLIAAAERAQAAGADIHLLFAGIGVEAEFVKQMAEEKDFVRFLGSYKQEAIGSLYGQVDAVYAIYDQSYDKRIHLAYRLCESINCGLPIIVAADTHMADVVEKHDVGFAVPFGNTEQLTESLLDLCRTPTRREDIEENCEKARSDFVFETYEDTIRQAYAEVLAGQYRESSRMERPGLGQ